MKFQITLTDEQAKELYTRKYRNKIAEHMRKQLAIAFENKEKAGWKPFEKSEWRMAFISEFDTVDFERVSIVLSSYFDKFYTPDVAANALMQRIIVGYVNNEDLDDMNTIDINKTFE